MVITYKKEAPIHETKPKKRAHFGNLLTMRSCPITHAQKDLPLGCRVCARTWSHFTFFPFVLLLVIFNLIYIENSIPNRIGIYFNFLYNYILDLQRKRALGRIYLEPIISHYDYLENTLCSTLLSLSSSLNVLLF